MTIRLRHELTPEMEREIAAFFDRLGARAERRAREIADTMTPEERAGATINIDAARLITEKDTADLGDLFVRHYAQVFELLWDEWNDQIGTLGSFTIGDPFVERFAAESAGRVVAVADVTRDVIRGAIADAQKLGYGVDDLIRGVFDKDTGRAIVAPLRSTVSGAGLYPGIYSREYAIQRGRGATDERAREIAAEKASRYRALNIARTELGHAANGGAIARYESVGMVLAVRVYDGDGCGWKGHDDPDKAHGSIRPLEEAKIYTLAHPSCQRAFSAITDIGGLPADWGQVRA